MQTLPEEIKLYVDTNWCVLGQRASSLPLLMASLHKDMHSLYTHTQTHTQTSFRLQQTCIPWCQINHLHVFQCQLGVLPLGTGNDLARVLGWGPSCDDDTQLPQILEKLERASTKMLDRWSIMTYEIKIPPKHSCPTTPEGADDCQVLTRVDRYSHASVDPIKPSRASRQTDVSRRLLSTWWKRCSNSQFSSQLQN